MHEKLRDDEAEIIQIILLPATIRAESFVIQSAIYRTHKTEYAKL